jgi:hypothetical protein
MNQGNYMTKTLTTRRRLLQGAGLGAAVLAAPAIVRAAPASANFAFFVSTSRHCHINRFYWSVLTPWQRSVSIKSMG